MSARHAAHGDRLGQQCDSPTWLTAIECAKDRRVVAPPGIGSAPGAHDNEKDSASTVACPDHGAWHRTPTKHRAHPCDRSCPRMQRSGARTSCRPDRCVAPHERMLATYASHNVSAHGRQRSPTGDHLRDKSLAHPQRSTSLTLICPGAIIRSMTSIDARASARARATRPGFLPARPAYGQKEWTAPPSPAIIYKR